MKQKVNRARVYTDPGKHRIRDIYYDGFRPYVIIAKKQVNVFRHGKFWKTDTYKAE